MADWSADEPYSVFVLEAPQRRFRYTAVRRPYLNHRLQYDLLLEARCRLLCRTACLSMTPSISSIPAIRSPSATSTSFSQHRGLLARRGDTCMFDSQVGQSNKGSLQNRMKGAPPNWYRTLYCACIRQDHRSLLFSDWVERGGQRRIIWHRTCSNGFDLALGARCSRRQAHIAVPNCNQWRK